MRERPSHGLRRCRGALLGALLALGALAPALGSAQGANQAPECVTVRAQPWPAGFGFNHVVVVENHCREPVRCEVATNVDPSPRYELLVPPGEERSVATRSGSPASGFQPIYACELR